MPEIHPTAIVYEGTVLGEGVKVLEGAVVGKQPTLSPRSTAKREPLAPTTIGDGTIVSTGAIVFAGSQIGARVILGDQSCVRERVEIGDDVVLGRGSYVENDTTIGAMTKIQADAYITAYSTLEEHVFIAPCVVTTNDNWMGRTEKRFGNVKGPTIRRGARIGGGAILCPAIEIGEEAFVGAGAVVTKDVPAAGGDGREPGAPPARGARRGAAREPVAAVYALTIASLYCRRRASRASPGRSRCPSSAHDRRATRSGPGGPTGGRRDRPSQVVDVLRAGLPENQVRVGARRASHADEDGLAAPKPDRVDVVLVVPEVQRRLDPLRPAPEGCRVFAAVVVRLVPVARRDHAAELAQRGGDVESSPAGEARRAAAGTPCSRSPR